MKTIVYLITVFVLSFIPLAIHASISDATIKETLRKLDSLIEAKPAIHARQEAKIDSLRKEAVQAKDLWKKYSLYGSLFYEYLHYQADSSFYYVEKKEKCCPCSTIQNYTMRY